MADKIRRKLAAIISADVVGYSRLMNLDEDGTLGELKRCRTELIDPLVAKHGGRIFKTVGDGLLLEYSSIVDAVNFAVEMQRGMNSANRDKAPDKAIYFRVGVHLGEVIIDEEDVFGDGVNLASRIEALARTGGIAVSNDVYRQVSNRTVHKWEDGGWHDVKNIPEPVWIWHLAMDEQNGQIPSTKVEPANAGHHEMSIAVLPFDNMSGDPEQEYFCDGISEDLMTELARNPQLFVIARHSTFAYKGRSDDARRIGSELGVNHLLEGSVRRSDQRLRITAQLIETKTGAHLWAERYDRALNDVFAVQDDVVRNIVSALGEKLKPVDAPAVNPAPTRNLEAYEWLVRGRQQVFRAQGRNEARNALENAIELDPELSDAHAWLAIFHYSDWVFYHQNTTPDSMEKAIKSAKRAIELKPGSALAHLSLGIVNLYGGQREVALAALEQALELNPGDADVLVFLQEAYTFNGEPEKGISSVRRAMQLNPHCPEWYLWHLGFAYYADGRYQDAISALKKVLDIKEPSRILAAAYAMEGEMQRAHQTANVFMEAFPAFKISHWAAKQPFKHEDDLEKFVQGYRLAGLPD